MILTLPLKGEASKIIMSRTLGGVLGKIYEMAKEIKKETAKLCYMSYCEDCSLYQDDICLAVKAENLLQDIEEYLGEEYNEN